VPESITEIYRTAFRCSSAIENMGGAPMPGWLDLVPPGVYDVLGTAGVLPSGEGVLLAAPTPARARVPREARARWVRVAVHVAAALRLRRAAARKEPSDGAADEAVLDPSGRLRDATGEAAHPGAREALRRAVAAADRARGRSRGDDDAIDLWTGLVSGRWSLLDRFERDGRRFVVARRNPPGYEDPRALTGRERDVAASVARGRTLAFIAYELGLSRSTVAAHLARAMHKLGVTTRADLAELVAVTGPA